MEPVSRYAVTAEVFFKGQSDKQSDHQEIMEMEGMGPYLCSGVWLVLRGLMLLADKQDKDL